VNEEARPQKFDIARLAREIADHFGDLLRIERLRSRDSKVYRHPQFGEWLATEARAVVESGLEADQWTTDEVRDLAERMRGSVLASRCGVRQISGAPVCVEVPETERGARGFLGASQRGAAPWVQLATAAGIGRELWDEECDAWVTVPDDLTPGNYVALNVRGDSMLPLLHDGDTVLIGLGLKPRTGTIVVARSDEGYVVKRLNRITTRGVYLDSLNPVYEPVVIRDAAQPIAGSVVLRWCPHDRV
jgi:hypothetical protein